MQIQRKREKALIEATELKIAYHLNSVVVPVFLIKEVQTYNLTHYLQ
jgi:hypothetical protein